MNVDDGKELQTVVRSCLGTKMMGRWMDLAVRISIDAVRTIASDEHGRKDIDIKRFIRIEKVFL